ncbi:uncharacterized protein EMH_0059780 [Eimeria mitis]|uniref:Haloacid dehalogenase-like hydrolase domain-containing protein n=1 Tax=Eimeria mitis TaxID=44415 RepID=U6K0T4_9EIME|nr:uncharacterized protein EMH_0059780 [Eimeria mitis]CDJ30606.1 hypothetical protein, conserved [Eimeria mitis]
MALLNFVLVSLAIAASPATAEESASGLQPGEGTTTGATSASSVLSKPVSLILSDIDGTLVGKDGVLPADNVEAFRLAHSLGIQVAVATGRPRAGVIELLGKQNLEKMEFSGSPGIYLNGAYVLGPGGKVLRDTPIAHDTLKQVLNVIEEEGLLHKAIGVTEGPLIHYESETTQAAPHSRVYKVHVEGEPTAVARVRSRLETELGDKIGFAQSHMGAFEVVPPGVDKGEALRLLCEALGVSPEVVLVLGNAHNDLSMFEVAGTAVAVGDGYASAKEAADFVTVPSTGGALMQVLLDIIAGNLWPKSSPPEGTDTDGAQSRTD